ncbi:MAG TPA: hypothetical protein VGG25_27380 [Streptosporangiaceae bacterium]|jgi:hypothetical protein
MDRSVVRAEAARRALAAWLASRPADSGPRGVVLTGPGAVAWATGGIAAPVDRTAATELTWVVMTPDGASLITTQVEADRIAAEYDPAAHDCTELVAVPWYEPAAFVTVAQELAGAPAAALAADGHPAFGQDAGEDLIALRLALSPAEQDDLRDLAAGTPSGSPPGTRWPGTRACPAARRLRTPTWSPPAAWTGSPRRRAGRRSPVTRWSRPARPCWTSAARTRT